VQQVDLAFLVQTPSQRFSPLIPTTQHSSRTTRAVCIMAIDTTSQRAQQQQLGSLDAPLSSGDSITSTITTTTTTTTTTTSSTITTTSSSNSSSAAAEQWRGPKALHGLAQWAAQPEARPTLGVGYERHGVLGVAQLDSFGDVVPPKALDARRDGAIGWIKRDGASRLMVAGGCLVSGCVVGGCVVGG